MHFLHNSKRKKKNKPTSDTSLPLIKERPLKKRPLSVQSTPGQIQMSFQSSSTPIQDSKNGAVSLKDIVNTTSPYKSSSNNGILSSESQRVLNSKIRHVRSQRPGKAFLHLNRSHSRASSHTDDSTSDVDTSFKDEPLNEDLFTPSKQIGPAAVEFSIPIEHPDTPQSLAESSQLAPSINGSKQQANEVEEHMANPDSTVRSESGIFSSLIHAAQNAATSLGNITTGSTDIKPHYSTPSSAENNDTTGLNFMQHLDTLLFNQPAKKSITITEEKKEQPDDVSTDRLNTKSYAHDVKFQHLRKSAVLTMGKGGLTLEDLGFTESSQYSQADISGNASQKSPNIKMSQASPLVEPVDGNMNGNGVVLPLSSAEKSPRLTFENHQLKNSISSPFANSQPNNGTIPPLKLDNQKVSIDEPNKKCAIISRTNSTSNVKRSLSPAIRDSFASRDTSKRPHSLSLSSVNNIGDLPDNTVSNQAFKYSAEHNGNITHSLSSSSVDLKNVTYANEKRNNEFHNIFKTLSKSERLIDDFSCALQKDILVQGKLYLSQSHISFNSNILGWVTNFTIPIQEVVQLEKKTTAGLFPNGIVIQTLHQRYSFTTFLTRDATFHSILNVWNQLVRGSADLSDENELNSEFGLSRQQSFTSNSEDYSTEEGDYDSDDFDVNADDDNTNGEGGGGGSGNLLKHPPTEPEHEEQPNEKKVTESIISAPVSKVYQALFGNNTSTLNKILEKQKNFDISQIPSFTNEDGIKKRSYSYIKPLNSPVGPKQTSCQVTETLDFYDPAKYIKVTQDTKTPDVPSGTSFSVNTTFYLSWGPNNSTKILVYTVVSWTAKSWIKGAVEKGAIDGQKESIGILVDELQSIFESSAATDADEDGDSSGIVSTLPTIGPPTHSPTENEYTSKQGDTEITTETISAPLGTTYQLLFGDDTSYFKSILAAQKNFDLTDIPSFDGTSKGSTRKYSYTKPLGSSIGPKETRCNITETIEHFDLNKYIQVLQVTSTPDVPSGGSFTIHTDIYLSWARNNSTQIFVVTNVVWTGKSWIKGPIEKGSIDGQKDSVNVLVNELKSIIVKAESGGGKNKKKKKGKNKNVKKEPSPNLIDEVLKDRPVYNFLSSFEHSSLNSFSVLFFVFIGFWVSLKVFSKSSLVGNKVAIQDIDKALIGGKEFYIIPSVDQAMKEQTMKEKAEFDIWEWINDRTDIETKTDKKRGVAKFYEEQQMRELIREAESKIEALKRQIGDKYE